MALRLDQIVLSGELINTKHYSTHGWLEFRGRESPVMLQLTGNCGPELAGCHIRFAARPELQEKLRGVDDASPQDAADIDWLADQQVGPTGTMTLRQVKWFDCPIEELYQRCKLDEPPPFEMKPSLYLEWYSQNGRVVLELVDPEIEFVERGTIQAPAPGAHLVSDPPPIENPPKESDGSSVAADFADSDPFAPVDEADDGDAQTGLGVTMIGIDDDGTTAVDEQFYPSPAEDDESLDEESDDASTDDLQRQLDRQADEIDWALKFDCHDDDKDECIRELELMDELIERRTADWMIDMIDHPEKLPRPCDLSEADAEGPLKSLLMQLAVYGIAIHVCPHYTPKETYRWLLEDIFQEELAHKELKHTQWVQGFDTGESSCPACTAEFEREWAARESNNKDRDGKFDDIPPPW